MVGRIEGLGGSQLLDLVKSLSGGADQQGIKDLINMLLDKLGKGDEKQGTEKMNMNDLLEMLKKLIQAYMQQQKDNQNCGGQMGDLPGQQAV